MTINNQGDVLIYSTVDGGEINFNNGIIQMTQGFDSMVYLLLFGGNIADDGTESTKKYEWWGNKTENNNPERKIHSRFQNLLKGLPATPANLKRLHESAKQDLQVLIDEKIVDKINIESSIPSKNRVNLVIDLSKDGRKIYETKFEAAWGAINGS